MKRKWIVLPLSLTCAATVIAAAACNQTGNEETVRDYTFEDYTPEGLAQPDEGFKIDGVLDESEYANQRWLRAVKVAKDEDNLNYDTAVAEIADAAQFGMTSYFGTKGVYIAVEYKAGKGESLYANPDRSSTQNSITELYLATPQSQDIEDVYVCEIDMAPDGELNFKKNDSHGNWDNFATTNDIMAQLGAQTDGVLTEFVGEGEQRATKYTMELFIPWDYLDLIGGDGTADLIKEEGELRLNAAPITSYNYLGTDSNVDRWWWMIGSQLDDGAWGNVDGWYHFDENGLKSYDIEIDIEGEGGGVMERLGYDFAVANNSVTFLTKADQGYALESVKVNGVDYTAQTTSVGSGYFVVPASAVTEKLVVEAKFVEYVATEEAFTANVKLNRLGTATAALDGTVVTLVGSETYTLTVEDGKISGEIYPGTYAASVAVDGETFLSTSMLKRLNNTDTIDLVFGWDAFTSMMFSNVTGVAIDDSHANDENGYIINTQGNTVIASLNQTSGDSVFTVNFRNAMASVNNRWGIDYLYNIEGQDCGVRVTVKVSADSDATNGKMVFQWYGENGGWNWGISNLNPIWDKVVLENDLYDNDAYKAAFLTGDGIELMGVRSGNMLYYFAGIRGAADSLVYCGCFELTSVYTQEGTWTIDIADATTGHQIFFDYSEDADVISDLVEYSVTLPTDLTGGTVTADKTTAKINETITVSVQADANYILSELKVNGEPVTPENGKITLSYAKYGSEITVTASFAVAPPVDVSISVPALSRFGKAVSLDEESILFTANLNNYTLTVQNGSVSGQMAEGVYTAQLVGYEGAVAPITVTITKDGADLQSLDFKYEAFGENVVGNPGDTPATVDDSKANAEGYITANGKFWTLANEKTGNSVFTVSLKASDIDATDGAVYFGYLFSDNKGVLAQLEIARKDTNNDGVNDTVESLKLQWRMWSGDYISDDNILNIGWGGDSTTAFNEAFLGDGIDITFVRDGLSFYLFLSARGDSDALSFRTVKTIPESYASQQGQWAFGADKPTADAKFGIALSRDPDEVIATVNQAYFNVAASVEGGNAQVSLSADKAYTTDGSITLTVSLDEGYAIDQLLVNGTNRASDVVAGKITFTFADCADGTRTVTVKVTTKEQAEVAISADVSAKRLGEDYIFENNTQLQFAGEHTVTLSVTEGKVSGDIMPGSYTVTVVGNSTYSALTVTVGTDGTVTCNGTNALVFGYDAFEAGGFGNMNDLVINEDHANDANGYIVNKHHNTVLANTTESFGDSVFTVTFKNSQATNNNRWGIEYLVEVGGTQYGVRATVKVGADNDATKDKMVFQWYGEGNPQWAWGISNLNPIWDKVVLENDTYTNDQYKTAFLTGDGIDFTVVRSGDTLYYFASIHGKADSAVYCGQFTLTGDYTVEGHWAIAIADAKQDESIYFDLSEDADEIAAWVAKVPAGE